MAWSQLKKKTVLAFILAGIVFSSSVLFAESDPPMDRVPLKDARAKALRAAPGKVRDFEFEIRKDKWVYFFKIIGKDHRIHRIVVDAVSGKIVSKSSEAMPADGNNPAVPSKSQVTKK